MGKPVIAPRTQGILDYFDEGSLYFFEPEDVDDLARVIFEVYSSPNHREQMLKKGINIYRGHRWSSEKTRLIDLIKSLTNHNAVAKKPAAPMKHNSLRGRKNF